MKPGGLQKLWLPLDIWGLSVTFEAPFPWALQNMVELQVELLCLEAQNLKLGVFLETLANIFSKIWILKF